MPSMDVVIGQAIGIVLGVLFIGVLFADIFVNKQSYTLMILKYIGNHLNVNNAAKRGIEDRKRRV